MKWVFPILIIVLAYFAHLFVYHNYIQIGRSSTFELQTPYEPVDRTPVKIRCWNEITQQPKACHEH